MGDVFTQFSKIELIALWAPVVVATIAIVRWIIKGKEFLTKLFPSPTVLFAGVLSLIQFVSLCYFFKNIAIPLIIVMIQLLTVLAVIVHSRTSPPLQFLQLIKGIFCEVLKLALVGSLALLFFPLFFILTLIFIVPSQITPPPPSDTLVAEPEEILEAIHLEGIWDIKLQNRIEVAVFIRKKTDEKGKYVFDKPNVDSGGSLGFYAGTYLFSNNMLIKDDKSITWRFEDRCNFVLIKHPSTGKHITKLGIYMERRECKDRLKENK